MSIDQGELLMTSGDAYLLVLGNLVIREQVRGVLEGEGSKWCMISQLPCPLLGYHSCPA